LVAEIDSADALVALLNAGGLAADFDLEPDAANAGRLHGKPAGLSRNTRIRLVTADHRVERAMPAHLFIDDHIDINVTFGLHPRGKKPLHCHDVARHSALHIAGAAAVDA